MPKPVLVAVDPRRDDHEPLALGLRLARLAGASVLLAATYPIDPAADRVHPELSAALRGDAERALARAADLIRDVPGPRPVVEVQAPPARNTPARALHSLVLERKALMLVIGSSTRGPLGRVSPGAVTDRLLHGAPCPVAVAPRGLSLATAERPLELVGAAYVDAPHAKAALRAAIAIARAADAYLRLLVVMRAADWQVSAAAVAVALPEDERARREEAELELSHGLELARPALPGASGIVLDGEPAAALAGESADLSLLVCGSRDFGPLRTLLLGGTSHALVRRAACPVLVVPRGTEERLVAAFGAARAEAIA